MLLFFLLYLILETYYYHGHLFQVIPILIRLQLTIILKINLLIIFAINPLITYVIK